MAARRTQSSAGAEAEERFLSRYDAARYPQPSLTVDVALVCGRRGALHTLVVRRAEAPKRGRWASPAASYSPTSRSRRPRRGCSTRRGCEACSSSSSTPSASPRATRARASSPSRTTRSSIRPLRARLRAGDLELARCACPGRARRAARSSRRRRRRAAAARLRPRGHPRDGGEAPARQARLHAHRLPAPAQAFTLLELQRVHETVSGAR